MTVAKDMNTAVLSRAESLPDEQKLQAEFALAAFSTIKAKDVAYISVPITSGKRLYDYMSANGFATVEEAKADHDAFFRAVVAPNLAAGVAAGNVWSEKMDGAVVAPAEFEKRLRSQEDFNWGQDAFMSMWIPLIAEKITLMVMVDGWEYSNGSGEEYLQAALMQMGRAARSDIEIKDEHGKTLTLDQGIGRMADAFKDLTRRGIEARNMAETLALLLEAEHRYYIEKRFNHAAKNHGGYVHATTELAYNHEKVKAIRKELLPILQKNYPDIQPTLLRLPSSQYSPVNNIFPDKRKKTPALVAA